MPITCENYVRLWQFKFATALKDSAILKNIIWQIKYVNYAIPYESSVERHNKPDYVGFTALHFAVSMADIDKNISEEAVKLLLERGADPTLRSRSGFSPLRLATERSWKSQCRCMHLQGRLEHPILELLLSGQVKAGIAANVSCKHGVSHFHLACMLNHDEAVRFFLDVGGVSVDQAVNQDSPELPGYTAMHFAARYGSFDAVRLLLERGADSTIADAAGVTPLQLLVERNLQLVDVINSGNSYKCNEFREELEVNEKMLDLWLNKFETIHSGLGMSELHALCARRSIEPETIERLVERGVNVNAAIGIRSPVRPGYTALHIAAHFNIESVMLLLKHGADVEAQDLRGVTPFDICASRFKPKDVSCIIDSVKGLGDISLCKLLKLLDIMQIRDPRLMDGKYFSYRVPSDSPLWAGYTMLHLAVEFARSADSVDDISEKRSTPKGRVDESSKKLVRACLKFIDPSTQAASGMTALHLAFRQRKGELTSILLDAIEKKGMRTNPSDYGNLTHLHIMCAENRVHTIGDYLDNYSCNDKINLNLGVPSVFKWYNGFPNGLANAIRPGSTALHLAVIFEQATIIPRLLQHGADPLAADADGLTPYMLAFLKHSFDLFVNRWREFPLAELRPTSVNPVSSEGLSHFHAACHTNDLALAEELLRNGLADLEAPINCQLNDTHKDRFNFIKSRKYYFKSQYSSSDNYLRLAPFSGYRALHMAVEGRADLETVELLLRHGADTQARNTAGLSPLQLALQHFHRNQSSENIVHRLAEKSAEHDGLTALHVACLLKDGAAVEKAIAAGVDVDARLDLESPIWPGSTALHLLFGPHAKKVQAYRCSDEILVEKLLNCGANVNQPDAENSTPLHLAYNESCMTWIVNCSTLPGTPGKSSRCSFKYGFALKVKLMLKSSRILEANPVDNLGISHFHIVCALADGCLVESYLDAELADVNQPTHHFGAEEGGSTPLHYAMAHGNYEAVEVLLRRGANVLAEDRLGNTPLHMALLNEKNFSGPDYFRRCIETTIKANTDVLNTRNILGQTPLELYLNYIGRSPDIVELFLKHGACANAINPTSRRGFLLRAVRVALEQVMDYAKDLTIEDPVTGFNAIHNIVSDSLQAYSDPDFFQLKSMIERLMKKGCDIDHQDSEGKTPLHLATILASKRFSAVAIDSVKALLQLGADINIVDNTGKFLDNISNIHKTTRAFGKKEAYNTTLFNHLNKMKLFKLPMSAENNRYCYDCDLESKSQLSVFAIMNYDHLDSWLAELKSMTKVKVLNGFSLKAFLSERRVAKFHGLAHRKQEAIIQFLDSIDLDTRFPHFAGLLRLQRRRCLMDPKLCKYALDILARRSIPDCQVPAGYQVLPDSCSDNIIRFLDNERIYNLSNLAQEDIKRAKDPQTDDY